MKLTILALVIWTGVTVHAAGAGNVELPNVLIIGDSICKGYKEPLVALMAGEANVVKNGGNASHSRYGLTHLDKWLGETKWDVIHFNHGLHDLKYVRGESGRKEDLHIQVPIDEYRKNMEAIVIRLKKTGAKLIFATTTAYPEDSGPRKPEDAKAYNAVALEIMKRHGVMIHDLYAFVLPQLNKLQKPKNVHFTDEGSLALAKEVAAHVRKAIGQ